jgi:hypothetical protein
MKKSPCHVSAVPILMSWINSKMDRDIAICLNQYLIIVPISKNASYTEGNRFPEARVRTVCINHLLRYCTIFGYLKSSM